MASWSVVVDPERAGDPERSGDPGRDPRLPTALRPFANDQYRLLAIALTCSLFGGGVWIIAIVASVFVIEGTPADLSLVATGTAIGMLVAVLFGGAAADRIPQRRILLVVETARAITVSIIAVIAITGGLEVWHLAVAGLALGLAEGAFYPAYSALLPRLLPAHQLLAANGVEGMLRPIAYQAAGPAASSLLVLLAGPAAAFVAIGVTQIGAIAALVVMRPVPMEREPDERGAIRGFFGDMAGGVTYVVRTPWLFATLLFASLVILVVMGPFEVLVPFAVRDHAGGDEASFALVLAMFGIGGAIGSFVVASRRLPRRYLTVMNLMWTAGCVPMAFFGIIDQVWLFALLAFAMGLFSDSAGVIWGTILQRRIPTSMLGRVSSLDFFVTIALMPVSMAIAGPIGQAIGLGPVFLVAGVAPLLLALAVTLIARLHRDEIANPLHDALIEPDAQETLGPGAPIHG